MIIRSAEFLISAASSTQFPSSPLPEVAFAGKSNVGKSSLMNCLLNRKGLVKTSSTPGKTREINFFSVNGTFRLVDLPGYGFAKVHKSKRQGWERLIGGYLRERLFLNGVVLILDARHPPSKLDQEMLGWLAENAVPLVIVANKLDKLKRSQSKAQLELIRRQLDLPGIPLPFSARTRVGREALWEALLPWLQEQEGAGLHTHRP